MILNFLHLTVDWLSPCSYEMVLYPFHHKHQQHFEVLRIHDTLQQRCCEGQILKAPCSLNKNRMLTQHLIVIPLTENT